MEKNDIINVIVIIKNRSAVLIVLEEQQPTKIAVMFGMNVIVNNVFRTIMVSKVSVNAYFDVVSTKQWEIKFL